MSNRLIDSDVQKNADKILLNVLVALVCPLVLPVLWGDEGYRVKR